MYRISKATDFLPLSELFHHSGLEVEPSERTPEETLRMWKCEDADTGELLAAATIQYKSGCYVLEHLAVKERCRGTGLGKELLEIAEEELRRQGAKEMWLCAKVPEFYQQYGWIEVPRETAPQISNCQKCAQFNKSCFPSIMKKQA